MPPRQDALTRGVAAVLGPTNTGKTHLAIERMLGHDSGVIGLPLRLLAREVYGRIAARIGVGAVALVTGEEKIKPPNPRYWVATVEAMPRDIAPSFVAIDEVQMIADAERGHIFTDALLHRRGRAETLLLGAGTAEPLLRALLPGLRVETRPRLSQLAFAGAKKISRLPRRSAIIAFSLDEVYAIGELVRRQRGGIAVVMGSLSPRTRNAQVELYQAGEVEHIVATDAIGMGLNLDIAHVAFAADRKFDGHRQRRLFPAEVAQIAGRAGRSSEDGSFGTTGRCPPLDAVLVEALEAHRFDPLKLARWRNSALDFSSLSALEQALARTPGHAALLRTRKAEDETTLAMIGVRPAVRDLARGEAAVRRLWDLCQLPDYRKVSPQSHADLVAMLYEAILRKGAIDHDWFAREIRACDRLEGDIDALSWRLAQIRTYAYCANRTDWLRDAVHWQNVTRRLEDRVSDALHERLMQRFVDRRTSVLLRRLKENAMLDTDVKPTGEVMVEGQLVGRLEGFRFTPDASDAQEARRLRLAADKALAPEIEARATRFSTANDDQIQLSLDGVLRYIGEPVASLAPGAKVLEPGCVLLADDTLNGLHRELVETRLNHWIKAHVARLLGPLLGLEAPEGLGGMARGLAFRLYEALGVLDRARVAGEVHGLDQNARGELRRLGVRFGAYHLFLPALMKPGPRSLAAQLFALTRGDEGGALRDVSHLAFSGRTSIPIDPAIDRELYRVAGFRVAGPRALRVDILERLADQIRPAAAYRPGVSGGPPPPGAADGDGFVITGAMTSLLGCAGAEFGEILRALGYRSETRIGPAITVALKAAPPAAAAAPEAVTPAPEAAASATIPEAAASATIMTGTALPAAAMVEAGALPLAASGAAILLVEAPEARPPEPSLAGSSAAEPSLAEPSAAGALASGAAPAALEAAAMEIEIWRQQRSERHAHHRPRPRRDQRGESAACEPRTTEPERGEARRDARGKRFAAPPRSEAGPGEAREARVQRPGFDKAGEGKRFESGGKERRGKPRPDERGSGFGRGFSDAKPAAHREPDPDSPFAKLAALKAQLESKK